jgi:hypothetical protein
MRDGLFSGFFDRQEETRPRTQLGGDLLPDLN